MGTARAAAEEAGRDPAELKCIVCAPSMVTDDIALARDETRWFPAMVSNHVQDLIERYGTDGSVIPKDLTDYVAARKFYDYNEHSRVGAKHGAFVTGRDLRPLLGHRQRRPDQGEAAGARDAGRRPLLDLPDDPQPGGDPRRLRGAHHPRVQGRGGIDDAAAEQVEAWRSVAAGWERRRDLFARSTAALSERMVELLQPEPGQRILELAAGPGEVGFFALPRLHPGGELISTDVAPEMVDTARRRAEELGLEGVRFSVEDAAALTLGVDSVDGVLCRFGLMLVTEMGQAASEMARVTRPGGRVVLAVWAGPQVNPWITASGKAALELGLVERPDPEAPGPFRLSDPDRLASVVTSGGLAIERVEDFTVTWVAGSLDEWWETTEDTSRMLSALLERLSSGEIATLRARAMSLLEEHVAADGSLSVPGVARIVVATA